MVRRMRSGPNSFADFLELIPEDRKADLLDGVITMASPENTDHNDLVLWLGKVIGLFVDEHQLGRVTINKVAFRLTDRTAPEPDLAFVQASRIGAIKRGYVEGPPDVAVEIVSPDSVDRDYEDKRYHYEAAGVQEYWIIDVEESRATFLQQGSGGFVVMPVEEHIFRSGAIPGFAIDVRWLWQRPLPRALGIVQEMLQNAPPREGD